MRLARAWAILALLAGLGTCRAQPPPTVGPVPPDTPYDVAPSLLNREEVARAMYEALPPGTREAGLSGVARVYFHIDSEGRVQEGRLASSSGDPEVDRVALAVAPLYRFAPATFRGLAVPVWVVYPIVLGLD